MVVVCSIKDRKAYEFIGDEQVKKSILKSFREKPDVEIIDEDFIWTMLWAQWDGLKNEDERQVSIINSYGQVLLRCSYRTYEELFKQ